MLTTLLGIVYGSTEAQKKKVIKKSVSKTSAVKFTPKEFGTPSSVNDVKDLKETDPAFESVKNLVETNGVQLVYADNTFRPKDPLRQGDFIVSLNSALEAIKKSADASGADSTVFNTKDNSQPYVTSVNDIKDLKESSIYYPAAQSLIEKYGVGSAFTKSKTLNAGATVPESEVYDVLKTTLGYTSPGTNPYSAAMSRSKFAMVLNNAVNQKLSQVNAFTSGKNDFADSLRREQNALIKQQEKQTKDSLTKQAELSKIDVQKKQAEAWTKLSDREKRKQIKSQGSK